MRRFRTQLMCLIVTSYLATGAIAKDWSQFRGTNASGIVEGVELPVSWGPDDQVQWKIRLPGVGWSQPIVWGKRIYVTAAETDKQAKPDPKSTGPGIGGYASLFSAGTLSLPAPNVVYRWRVLCLDADSGNTLWERTAREGTPTIPTHANNTYASETPATDGERLIAYFGMTGVYCYDLEGNPLWTRDLGAQRMQFGWGTGSSPILFGNKIYIQCDNDDASFLVALDNKTGKDVWRVPREEKSNWATPYIWKNTQRTELVTAGGGQMRSYDPESGQLLWSMRGDGRTATTPVGDADLLYVDSYDRLTGGSGSFAAVRPGASGNISLKAGKTSNSHVAWSTSIRGYRMASPILAQGCVYVLEQHAGIVHCIDAKTGKEHYRKRLPGARGFTASPLVNRDNVYCVDQNCRTTVLKAGPDLQVIGANDLGEMCWASPAVAGDSVLFRTVDHLYSIGQK
jgi:outer membrane protein assembly factor BamB